MNKKKICILTPRFPFPENGGDVLRINAIARYLKNKGHQLILISLIEDPLMEASISENIYDKIITIPHSKVKGVLGSLFSLLFKKTPLQCGYYTSRQFKKAFHKIVLTANPDLYIAHLTRMAPYLIQESLIQSSIVEMTDALSVTYSLSKRIKGGRNSFKKLIYRIEEKRIKSFEQFIIDTFKKVILVSNKDIDYLRSSMSTSTKSLYCFKNGVTLHLRPICKYDVDKICFVGNMRTLQNQDAVLFFIDKVFPLLLKKRPNSKLYIVGAQPTASISNLASDNIIITGFVNSIYDYIFDSCYAIAPIQIAAGVQNKVLLAMSYHIPVIMTSLIATAIPETSHRSNCLIANTPEEFLHMGLSLSEDCSFRNLIAENGYKMVRDFYSWDTCLSGYEEIP